METSRNPSHSTQLGPLPENTPCWVHRQAPVHLTSSQRLLLLVCREGQRRWLSQGPGTLSRKLSSCRLLPTTDGPAVPHTIVRTLVNALIYSFLHPALAGEFFTAEPPGSPLKALLFMVLLPRIWHSASFSLLPCPALLGDVVLNRHKKGSVKGRKPVFIFFLLPYFVFKLVILYWNIADGLCCDSYRWRAEGLGPVCACVHSPPDSPPVRAAT